MNIWSNLWPLGLIAFFMTGCNYEGQIPVIGVDQNGNPTQVMVSEKDYTDRLTTLISSVQDSALPVLNRREVHKPWMLRTLVFGIGVNAEVGVGPLIKVGAYPRTRLVFSNSTDPTLP